MNRQELTDNLAKITNEIEAAREQPKRDSVFYKNALTLLTEIALNLRAGFFSEEEEKEIITLPAPDTTPPPPDPIVDGGQVTGNDPKVPMVDPIIPVVEVPSEPVVAPIETPSESAPVLVDGEASEPVLAPEPVSETTVDPVVVTDPVLDPVSVESPAETGTLPATDPVEPVLNNPLFPEPTPTEPVAEVRPTSPEVLPIVNSPVEPGVVDSAPVAHSEFPLPDPINEEGEPVIPVLIKEEAPETVTLPVTGAVPTENVIGINDQPLPISPIPQPEANNPDLIPEGAEHHEPAETSTDGIPSPVFVPIEEQPVIDSGVGALPNNNGGVPIVGVPVEDAAVAIEEGTESEPEETPIPAEAESVVVDNGAIVPVSDESTVEEVIAGNEEEDSVTGSESETVPSGSDSVLPTTETAVVEEGVSLPADDLGSVPQGNSGEVSADTGSTVPEAPVFGQPVTTEEALSTQPVFPTADESIPVSSNAEAVIGTEPSAPEDTLLEDETVEQPVTVPLADEPGFTPRNRRRKK